MAQLEMVYNQVNDSLLHWKYEVGLAKPEAAWEVVPASTRTASTPSPLTNLPTLAIDPEAEAAYLATRTWAATFIPKPVLTPTPFFWQQTAIPASGSVDDEGIWSAYIKDAYGKTVAFRTFLLPDPNRPYTQVAVVAIDLNHTSLHFILGTEEPSAAEIPPRSGKISAADKVPNVLLAAFNGGFQSRHGKFGAMSEGITVLPPREGVGTLVIYANGTVEMGEWGEDKFDVAEIVSLRQNGPLVIEDGTINPRIYNHSPKDWGYTVTDVSPTVRSGLGLSADGQVLYYFCGPSLSVEMLAKSMQAVGVWHAIQLDINNYWVLFVKIQAVGSKLVPDPLLPRLMVAALDRYLYDSSRDFFYITSTEP